jgi:hypothetical protein
MKIGFSDEQEWLAELLADQEEWLVQRRIVRLTIKTVSNPAMPIANVYVLGAYYTGAEVMELERFCGQAFADQRTDNDGIVVARRLMEKLHAEVEKHGFEIRAGRFITDDGERLGADGVIG